MPSHRRPPVWPNSHQREEIVVRGGHDVGALEGVLQTNSVTDFVQHRLIIVAAQRDRCAMR